MTRTEKKRCIALVIALIFILCGCSGSSGKKDEWYRVKQIYVVDGRVRSTRSWDLDEQNRKSVEYLDGAWNAEWTYDEDGNIATYEYMEYSYKVRVEYTYEDGLLTTEVRRAEAVTVRMPFPTDTPSVM